MLPIMRLSFNRPSTTEDSCCLRLRSGCKLTWWCHQGRARKTHAKQVRHFERNLTILTPPVKPVPMNRRRKESEAGDEKEGEEEMENVVESSDQVFADLPREDYVEAGSKAGPPSPRVVGRGGREECRLFVIRLTGQKVRSRNLTSKCRLLLLLLLPRPFKWVTSLIWAILVNRQRNFPVGNKREK